MSSMNRVENGIKHLRNNIENTLVGLESMETADPRCRDYENPQLLVNKINFATNMRFG